METIEDVIKDSEYELTQIRSALQAGEVGWDDVSEKIKSREVTILFAKTMLEHKENMANFIKDLRNYKSLGDYSNE